MAAHRAAAETLSRFRVNADDYLAGNYYFAAWIGKYRIIFLRSTKQKFMRLTGVELSEDSILRVETKLTLSSVGSDLLAGSSFL